MWFAGIGWRDDQYHAVVTNARGRPVVPLTIVPAASVREVVVLLQDARRRACGRLACVIDSSSGVLERHLIEAGLAVYRADPWLPGRRPGNGSTPAAQLATMGRRQLAALSRITAEGGAMDGRDDEVARANLDCAAVEQDLTADGRLVLRGSPSTPRIALTFDDGPSPDFTRQVLEVLRRYNALATFFCIGLNTTAFPRTLEEIASDGHEIGNHTWSHPYLPDLSRMEMNAQLEQTGEAIRKVTGSVPTLVRPPYGGRSSRVLRWLAEAGLTTVLWSAETSDWARPGTDVIEAEVAGQAGPGSIVLFHDGGGDRSQTVAALPRILRRLCGQGYQLVPVSQLLTVVTG